MTEKERLKIQNAALNIDGIRYQQWKLVEECGELLNAIAKVKTKAANVEEIITESADVSIIIEQLAYFYGLDDFKKERKLIRLKERLQEKLKP